MPRLTEDQRTTFEATGRVLLRGFLDQRLVRRLDVAARLVAGWADGSGPGLHHREMTDDGPRLARSEDLIPHHDGLRDFLTKGVVPDMLGELFGEPAVLFKEKINYKAAGGAGFAPHQDATAYRFVDYHISVMIPLDTSTEENGCLWFTPVTDRTVLPNRDGRIDPAWVEQAAWVPVPVRPGDVVAFNSYAPHYSDTNRSSHPRRALYVTYNARSAGEHRERYYADKRALLAAEGDGPERARISVNDDFLGRPVPDDGV